VKIPNSEQSTESEIFMKIKMNAGLSAADLIQMAGVRLEGLTGGAAGAANFKGQFEVKLAVDISGSFEDEWRSGVVAQLVLRAGAAAHLLDSDGAVDIMAFNTKVTPWGSVKMATTDVAKWLKEKQQTIHWGGTAFAPILSACAPNLVSGVAVKASGLFAGLFGSRQESAPVSTRGSKGTVVFILTDGDSQDGSECSKLAESQKDAGIYYMFINVDQLARTAAQLSAKYDFIGHKHFPKLSQMSDEEVFDSLLSGELMQWMQKRLS